MSIQEMEDLKQQYLDEMKRLINSEYRDEIKIDELKGNFNSMSIEINKKEKLQQLGHVANLSTYPSKRFNSFCYDDDDEDYTAIPSESEEFSDIESECDMPDCDDSQTKKFQRFPILSSTILHLVMTSQVMRSEFNPTHNEELDSNPKNDRFDTMSYLLESLLNRDTLMASSPKFDSLLEEFFGKLSHTDLIPPRINEANCDPEEDIHLVERLMYYSDSEGDNLSL
nr:hypothetical protein [Tanacetum cinerariifolium]